MLMQSLAILYRDIARGRVLSSLLISRVNAWIMAATHYITVRCNTLTTMEDAAEILEELDQNKLVLVYALNTGLAEMYNCNTILYE